MSQMDTNENTSSVTDTLKLRNTETAALKRMPSVSATSSASSAARKTIKLKPLSPQLVGGSTDPDPSSMSVAVPLMKMTAPSAGSNTGKTEGTSASAPQFMSTATAPVAKIQRPEPAPPLTGAASAPKGGTGTVSIPRISLKPKTVAPVSAPAAVASEKSQGTPAEKAPGEKSVSTASGSIPRYVATSTSSLPKVATPAEKTPGEKSVSTASGSIPKYAATSTSSLPKAVPPPPAGGAPKYVSTSTSPIPVVSAPENAGKNPPLKSAIDQAKLQSGMQGAKPAIKLRPSANPGGPAAGTTSSSPTIKLTPRTDSTVSPVPPAASPAAGSVSPTMTAKISRKNVTSSPVASAPTVELSSPTIQLESPANKESSGNAAAPAPASAAPAPASAAPAPAAPAPAPASAAPAPAPAAPAPDTSDPGVTTKIPRKLGLKKAESAPAPAAPASAASAPASAAPATEKKPAAPTLRKQDDIAKVNLTKNEGDGDQALQMGKVEEEPLEKVPVKKKKKVSGEPHMFFAVCVIIAFVVTLFVVYTLVAHYLNTWEGKKLPVVGFEQLDEHLSKK